MKQTSIDWSGVKEDFDRAIDSSRDDRALVVILGAIFYDVLEVMLVRHAKRRYSADRRFNDRIKLSKAAKIISYSQSNFLHGLRLVRNTFSHARVKTRLGPSIASNKDLLASFNKQGLTTEMMAKVCDRGQLTTECYSLIKDLEKRDHSLL